MPGSGQAAQIVRQAAQSHGVDPHVLWGIYGAESSFGKAQSSFGLTGDYPGVGTSGNFSKDANRAAQILARLVHSSGGNYDAALHQYSGNSYGIQHVQQLFHQNPIHGGGGGMPQNRAGRGSQGNPSSSQGQPQQAPQLTQQPGPLQALSGLLQSKSAFDIGPRVPGLGNPSNPLRAAGLFAPQLVQTPGQPAQQQQPQQRGGQARGPVGNPFARASTSPGRVDEGVDLTVKGPIVAPSDGTVHVYHYSGFGTYVEFVPKGGGRAQYFSESVTPVRQGQVRRGQVIAHSGGKAGEFGYSDPRTHLPVAKPQYTEGVPTKPGYQYQRYLRGLGVKA